MSIVWKLSEYLTARGITPYRLAKESGVSQQSVYPLINGRPAAIRMDTLERLISALERLTNEPVTVGDLLEFRKD